VQIRREHNERAWLAYQTALLPRLKKFPTLKSISIREPVAPQTAEQMLAVARQITLLLGGDIKGRPN